jgi:hypothetical protein
MERLITISMPNESNLMRMMNICSSLIQIFVFFRKHFDLSHLKIILADVKLVMVACHTHTPDFNYLYQSNEIFSFVDQKVHNRTDDDDNVTATINLLTIHLMLVARTNNLFLLVFLTVCNECVLGILWCRFWQGFSTQCYKKKIL